MTKISRDEVIKIATISRIALREDEIAPLQEQLEQVLSYAERVIKVATDVEQPSTKKYQYISR